MDPASLITGLFQLYVYLIYLQPVACTLLESTLVAWLKWPTTVHWRVTTLWTFSLNVWQSRK